MNDVSKKSLKLPLFLIIGPAVVTFLAVFLQAIVRPESSGPSGDAYVDYMNSQHDRYVFNNLPILEKLPTLALGLISIFGLVAIVPCFILGVILLIKRKLPDFKMNRISFATITANPLVASTRVILRDGSEIVVRPLIKSDHEKFGEFLSSLLPATNLLYQPHPLNKKAAQDICENLDYTARLPFVAVTATGDIVAYFLFDFTYSKPEVIRYKDYGVTIDSTKDCRFEPVVADVYQGQGIGKAVFRELLPILRQLPLRSLILSGGTQEGNRQAINFYEKIGFTLMGEFEENTMRNYDMMLVL